MADMHIQCGSLLEGAQSARGTAVVVDVYRAFTCAPLLFSMGVAGSILVATPEEAFDLKRENPDLVLAGEVKGIPIRGFDLGNSPSRILKLGTAFFRGKTVVLRTSAGVQGAIAALNAADEVLLGSYSLAGSTVRYLRKKRPEQVSIVAMGVQLKARAPEDEWCARYMAHLLGSGEYDHNQALGEIIFNETTQKFFNADKPEFPAEDPILCLQRDVYDFALRAYRQDGLVRVEKLIP